MTAAARSGTVSLAVPGTAEYVVLARLALSAVCRLARLEPDEVADLKLAITEVAADLIPNGSAEHVLDFVFSLDGRSLVLEISGGHRAEERAGEGAEPFDEQALGRAIIAATVDECEYQDSATRLVKYLPAAEQ